MKRSHSANTIGAIIKHGNPYDTIPAMLPRSRAHTISVKNVPSMDSGNPPPLPPPRKPKPHLQINSSMSESKLSVVRTAPKDFQKYQSAQQLILVEDETQNIKDFSDLDFLPNIGPIATTLNEEIAMVLPTISKHLLESAPSPARSTASTESPYEVIDKDIDENEYIHMGSDHSIRWSSNSSEFEGSMSSEISEKLESLTARINKLTNIVETSSKGEPTSADREALAENLPSKEELQPCDLSLSACELNRQLLATMDCNQVRMYLIFIGTSSA